MTDKEQIKSQLGNSDVIPFYVEKRKKWNNSDILPPNEILCGIFGSSGQGKTMFLLQLLPQICPKFLKHIIILSRIEGNEVYNAIEEWCKKTKRKYYFSSDVSEAMDVIEGVINDKEEDEHFVIVMDDFNEGCVTSRTNPYTKLTNEVFTKMRNYGGNMVFLVQSFTGLSTIARTNLNISVVFKILDQYALRNIKNDFRTLTGLREEVFDALHRRISAVKHSYFIYTSSGVWIYIHGKTPTIQAVDFKNSLLI